MLDMMHQKPRDLRSQVMGFFFSPARDITAAILELASFCETVNIAGHDTLQLFDELCDSLPGIGQCTQLEQIVFGLRQAIISCQQSEDAVVSETSMPVGPAPG